MAWELGLGDGLRKRVAIVPVAGAADALTTREFLLAYAQAEEGSGGVLLVREPNGTVRTFQQWVTGA